ncbi:unnamed protein product [Spodoptera littoralis]|uniref:Uncharacterized protein n=1 Tax=Spodoptera littoralis TaxID=7109 RepID=A0A9P0N0P2_SPOLI|nr:unnamed protein product [Spodoptera littoralis]CAH1640311.1 unnamed protein product [Spodoptera littoralis]
MKTEVSRFLINMSIRSLTAYKNYCYVQENRYECYINSLTKNLPHRISTMTFKVNILSALLFVCLIGCIHSARIKRDDADASTIPSEPATSEALPPSSSSTTKSPLDVSAIFDNFGQIFPANNSPNWMQGASAWFNNLPNWFGGQ